MARPIDPHEETAADSIRPGKMQAGLPIGGYQLIEVLGEGGMGIVWKAHDATLDRELAIKVLKRNDAPQALRQRLQREARAMARLKHPNVLTVYDSGTEGDRDFIAMELVDGSSLDEWLQRQPTRDDILAALLAAGRGLAAAHRAGLVHRDFKPHNVLRSNDGRVLVTDFGLARGLGEDPTVAPAHAARRTSATALDATVDATPVTPAALDATVEATPAPATGQGAIDETLAASPAPAASGRSAGHSKPDSVLDSPLTQTGALIGTPAYMAPEQFLGAPPDPRTDQFAFAVTAWQALTGGRPYTGATIAELRDAAALGVAHVRVDLPPRLRLVLVRGLEPDPADRWPTLDALLDALEAAIRPHRPRWIVPVVVLGLAAALGGVAVVARGTSSPIAAASPCVAADLAFGDAWSPPVRADVGRELAARGVTAQAFARIADPLDEFRTRWMQGYDEACRAPADKLPRARLGCLDGARDQAGAITYVLRTASPEMVTMFDPYGMLPNLTGCEGPSPVAPPALPADRRVRILGVLASTIGLRARPQLAATLARLEQEAADIGWPPLLARILVQGAMEYVRRGEITNARELLVDRARELARASGDAALFATAEFTMFEAAMRQLDDPASPIKPGGLPAELDQLLVRAHAAINAAGNDPILAGAVALAEAEARAARGRWTYGKREYKDAITLAQEAKAQFERASDPRRASYAAAVEASLFLRRGDDRALDDALFAVRTAEEALSRHDLPPTAMLDEIGAQIAFARGDFADARKRYLRLAQPEPAPSGPLVTGRVVAADGTPVPAMIVVWSGDLAGDPHNLATDPRTPHGVELEATADGRFEFPAAAGEAIVAQWGTERSTPQLVGAGPITIKLQRTTSIAGRVDGRDVVGVVADARYAAGSSTWTMRAPVARDQRYELARLPRGPMELGATATEDDTVRRVRAAPGSKLTWPFGRALELIVRGPVEHDARVWLYRGRGKPPASPAAADARAAAAPQVATSGLAPIGITATTGGQQTYARGDHHAVVRGNPAGWVQACASPTTLATAPVTCIEVEVVAPDKVFDFADGRYGTDTQPVVLELR